MRKTALVLGICGFLVGGASAWKGLSELQETGHLRPWDWGLFSLLATLLYGTLIGSLAGCIIGITIGAMLARPSGMQRIRFHLWHLIAVVVACAVIIAGFRAL